MSYRLEYATLAAHQLDRLDAGIRKRIISKIETLAEHPRPPGAIKPSGHDAYRIRVGDYRIIYGIQDNRLIVVIIEIGHRREVYRGF